MSNYFYTLLGSPWRTWKLTRPAIFHVFLVEYWVKQKSVNFLQGDAKGGQEDPPPAWPSPASPSLWQYISESARTEDFPPSQEAVGTGPGWLRWMYAAGIRQKLPMAALLRSPSRAWQLSITLLPLPVNYTNTDWQAACPTTIGKATQRTCSDDITAGPHTGNTGGRVCCCSAKVINRSTQTLHSPTPQSLTFSFEYKVCLMLPRNEPSPRPDRWAMAVVHNFKTLPRNAWFG